MKELRIPGQLLAEIDEHARRSYPEECCGALLGYRGVVKKVWPTPNEHQGRGRDRYAIPAVDLLQVQLSARRHGEEVVGYYHSHPDAAAQPSARDHATAWPGVSYLIVAVEDRVVRERRCWRLTSDGSRFQEEELAQGAGDGVDTQR